MRREPVSDRLMLKLSEISKIELNEISLLIAIIKKNIGNLINSNMKILGDEFVAKCEYYGESISNANTAQVEILNSYREEFNKIALKIEEEYINLSLELQEIQASQKISIANMKKTVDLKQKYIETKENEITIDIIDDYNRKIDMLSHKYIKYCGLEEVCIIKLRECNNRIDKAINTVMQYETVNKLAAIEKNQYLVFSQKYLTSFLVERNFKENI